MAARGKSLRLTDAEIDSLLASRYGRPETFALLAILFFFFFTRNVHHVDHIFPKSELTASKLKRWELTTEQIEETLSTRDQLPNLMLLEMSTNTAKSAKSPAEWLEQQGDSVAQSAWRDRNALPAILPDTPAGFNEFFEVRKSMLEKLVRSRLG